MIAALIITGIIFMTLAIPAGIKLGTFLADL